MTSTISNVLRTFRDKTETFLGIRIVKESKDSIRYAAYSRQSIAQRRFFNIGAGDFRHPFWTNMDCSSDWYKGIQSSVFINYDVMSREPLPLEDDHAEIIYTSHMIEHVSTESVANLFRECYRALKPGGVFRITCPDAELMYNATILNQRGYWEWRFPWLTSRGFSANEADIFDFLIIEICTSRSKYFDMPGEKLSSDEARRQAASLPMESYLDWLVAPCIFNRQYPVHMNWWTYNKCRSLLLQSGFEHVMRSTYGGSCAAPLQNTRYFDNTSSYKSFYMDAIK